MAVAWYVCLICGHLFVVFLLTPALLLSPLAPPIHFLASAHLLLVYTILRRVNWWWLPYVAVTLGWCLLPFSALSSGSPHAEAGAYRAAGEFLIGLLIIILQLMTLISLLVWRRSWATPKAAVVAEILVGSLILIGSGILDMRAISRKRIAVEQEREQWTAKERENLQLRADFVAAAQNGDRSKIDALEQRVGPLLGLSQLTELIKHSDASVRAEALRVLGKRVTNGSLTLQMEYWMVIVGNPKEQMQLRRDAMLYALLSDPGDSSRKTTLSVLSKLPDAAEVAVQPCAQFLEDRSRSHWKDSGAFLAPTDVVEFLASLGPSAVEALPALEAALDHPNDWTFVPAVVKAIAEIGQAGSRDALEKAAQFERPEVRNAAIAALKAFDEPTKE